MPHGKPQKPKILDSCILGGKDTVILHSAHSATTIIYKGLKNKDLKLSSLNGEKKKQSISWGKRKILSKKKGLTQINIQKLSCFKIKNVCTLGNNF